MQMEKKVSNISVGFFRKFFDGGWYDSVDQPAYWRKRIIFLAGVKEKQPEVRYFPLLPVIRNGMQEISRNGCF